MAKAVNLRKEAYDIYCGRPAAGKHWGFGNPFRVGRDGQQGECIPKFRHWIETGDAQGCPDATPERRGWMLLNMHTLANKRLGCFCKPRACHADVLAEYASEYE